MICLRRQYVWDLKTAKNVHFVWIESNLRHAIQFWKVCSKELPHCTFVLQKRAKCSLSCKPLFKTHQILTLTLLSILESASFIYKNKDAYANNNSSARFSGNLALIILKSTLVKESVIYNHIQIFNFLSLPLRNLNTLVISENIYLVDKPYYDLVEFYQYKLISSFYEFYISYK